MQSQSPTEIAQAVSLPPEFDGVDVAVVGGFVRDRLRGVESHDVDLMATDVTAAEMLDRGFQPIDATSFPVFHDSLGREVALPRTEESTGQGRSDAGFDVETVPATVDHAEAIRRDLVRRDLTAVFG